MEIWKDIVNYEGLYQVSNQGRIKSLERKEWCKKNNSYSIRKEKILKPLIKNNGYLYIDLCKSGIVKKYYIHRLVLINYKEYSKNKQCNHIDGNKQNNFVENLEWCTVKENAQHSIKTGLKKTGKGEKKFGVKLTFNEVVFIRSLIGMVSKNKIAKLFNISHSQVRKIFNYQSWSY